MYRQRSCRLPSAIKHDNAAEKKAKEVIQYPYSIHAALGLLALALLLAGMIGRCVGAVIADRVRDFDLPHDTRVVQIHSRGGVSLSMGNQFHLVERCARVVLPLPPGSCFAAGEVCQVC